MTELTRIAIATRKVIKYGFVVIVAIVLLRGLFIFGYGVYKIRYPDPPPAPTGAFGGLPKITFPQDTKPIESLTLQTPSGELPVFPDQLNVYFMPNLSSNLFSLENAKILATKLGFSALPQKLSETQYSFTNPNVPSQLKINIVTGAFSVSYNLQEDPSPFESRPYAPEVAISNVKSFLSSAGLLPVDFTGTPKHEFLRRDGNNLVTAISLSTADFVKINLYRKGFAGNSLINPPLENLPSLTARQDQSNVWFIVSGERKREKQIIAGEYHYLPVDEEKVSTYPIITAQQALDKLKAGEGFILKETNKSNIVIRRIYLGYFDPGVESGFLQPIVVFEGDNEFVAYVPAVTSEYYGK